MDNKNMVMGNKNMVMGTREVIIMFFIMFLISLVSDSMNLMVYSVNDIYLSRSIIISSLYMASTMLCAHQIIYYLYSRHFGKYIFATGIIMSLFFIFILRRQVFIRPNDWLKEMIPHHSTAITTTTRLMQNNKLDPDSDIYKLAESILTTQKREIELMKRMIV
jgi:hypothetical protein